MTILRRLNAVQEVKQHRAEKLTIRILIQQGYRYIGNSNTGKLHDLFKINNNCQIEEIIYSGNAVAFKKLIWAWCNGYTDSGWYCIGQ